ncbi:hypothetical protein JX266_007139 [Neoarthrinium moseri]|uniref:uncharacterized protein n=1 Tax=Neoarthrinium moseri TaxID=1658444 RepID=UPI001FDCDFB4|nr:uncharacterized protein JN550_003609 [Neoarthrinium moseri]KAI1846918.1 hypothetical protein JX266_007139 [Neoarthrinium moseri]KAI1872735.1 hypothetical protein JN550_003609 [Neoarthrinium moseri]
MASNTAALPTTHRALVLRDVNIDPKVEQVPVPEVLPGTALLRVLASPIISYTKDVFLGNKRGYPYPLPLVPGASAVCRVAALGPDATSLEIGQLVQFDCLVRARDAQDGPKQFLSAFFDGFSAASKKLMRDAFRDGTFAEYVRVPLENVFVLDESRLLGSPGSGGLGLQVEELGELVALPVPFGGLNGVDLKPGELVLISPATGPFGGAACMVALAMGAKVLAWGRDEKKLENVQGISETISHGRFRGMVNVVKLYNDPSKDAEAIKTAAGGRPIDVFFDISPPQAAGSTHLKTGIQSLRHSGRVSLMGGLMGDVPLPHHFIMHNDITLKGKWMYSRDDLLLLIKMVETGILKIGREGGCTVAGIFGLDDWKQAWDVAEEKAGLGEKVLIKP